MTDVPRLDSRWIAANPPPVHSDGTTKNSRGRVLAIGGSRLVPGALRLTGEAALRVGAGKLQLATIESAAMGLGLLVPEAAVLALCEDGDGEIVGERCEPLEKSLESCDTVVIGPGIGSPTAATAALRLVLSSRRDDVTLVIDAMAIGCARDLRDALAGFRDRLVITPHHGEMAMLTGRNEDEIADAPEAIAVEVAAVYGAIVVLKGSETVIATPDGTVLRYGGGGTGLATGGSGDVLAGAIGGLLSRGTPPPVAAGWGVWLHGQSGRRVATTSGPIGFLAREVPGEFPRLLPQ
jgi:ADP-dependent NAD(P)H-hydrate dehydratase